jgi:hypothetical protein
VDVEQQPEPGPELPDVESGLADAALANEPAQALVDKLVEEGEWPRPQLVRAIAAKGPEALEPLLIAVRREAEDWPELAPVHFAIRLLAILRESAAIPALIEQFRRHDDGLYEDASDTLAALGPAAIEPSLAAARDRALDWYARFEAIDAAITAAGPDLVLRSRVAEVLREILADELARAANGHEGDTDMINSLVDELAKLADPLARDLIQTAFDSGQVDPLFIGPEDVAEEYSRGGTTKDPQDPRDWLDRYEGDYHKRGQGTEDDEWLDDLDPLDELLPPVAEDAYEPPAVTAPIRNTLYRPGRNDPCWCGSGKKYKKCHLTRDESGT